MEVNLNDRKREALLGKAGYKIIRIPASDLYLDIV